MYNKKIIGTIITTCVLTIMVGCSNNLNESNIIETKHTSNYVETQSENIAKKSSDIEVEHPLLTLASYEEYKNFISDNVLPEKFVRYENLTKFGEFRNLIFVSDTKNEDYSKYSYSFKDSSDFNIYLTIAHKNDNKNVDTDSVTSNKQSSLVSKNDIDFDDMRHLKKESNGFYTDNDGFTYQYVLGKLLNISWSDNDMEYTLSGSSYLNDYPMDKDTFTASLLKI